MSFLRSTLFVTFTTLCASASFADTVSGSFDVTVKVKKACTVAPGSTPNVVFDDRFTTDAVSDTKTAIIAVKCSKTTPYEIGLTPGTHGVGTASTSGAGTMSLGNMNSPSASQAIPYQLQRAGGSAWGNVNNATIGTASSGNTVTGTGLGGGTAINHTVTAVVTGTSTVWDVQPGDYKDTVTVTVTY